VVICPLGKGSDTSGETTCTQKTAAWAAQDGLTLSVHRFAVQRLGVYFPLAQPYAFAAFFYLPQAAQ
jgi:hypothetical protein